MDCKNLEAQYLKANQNTDFFLVGQVRYIFNFFCELNKNTLVKGLLKKVVLLTLLGYSSICSKPVVLAFQIESTK